MRNMAKIVACSNGYIVEAYKVLPDDQFVFTTLEKALEFIADRVDPWHNKYKIIKIPSEDLVEGKDK